MEKLLQKIIDITPFNLWSYSSFSKYLFEIVLSSLLDVLKQITQTISSFQNRKLIFVALHKHIFIGSCIMFLFISNNYCLFVVASARCNWGRSHGGPAEAHGGGSPGGGSPSTTGPHSSPTTVQYHVLKFWDFRMPPNFYNW